MKSSFTLVAIILLDETAYTKKTVQLMFITDFCEQNYYCVRDVSYENKILNNIPNNNRNLS